MKEIYFTFQGERTNVRASAIFCREFLRSVEADAEPAREGRDAAE